MELDWKVRSGSGRLIVLLILVVLVLTVLGVRRCSRGGGGSTPEEYLAGSSDRSPLTVVIDGHQYLLNGEPVELEKMVPLVQGAVSNGQEVRVQRRNTSRASAEQDLQRELESRGVDGRVRWEDE